LGQKHRENGAFIHYPIIIQLKKIAMKKILIVDDEPNIVMSLEYTFKKIISSFHSTDGQEAF
jgi:PleD family two-component response regulator